MDLFNLPTELVHLMFEYFILSRSFKRAMRLRLVNRQFKTCIDETLFQPRILHRLVVDQVINDGDLTRLLEQVSLGPGGDGESEHGRFRNEWGRQILPFFVAHALREQSPHSTLGRVHRAAQAVSRIDTGDGGVTGDDADEDAVKKCLEDLLPSGRGAK
ncbi:hypothetical protein PG997_007097 [Apiospora hydei]|uniref:F-box domain-containing protein n=1 Tax=Apiospora hydei TaxID=1337664 RepID=A0ABR1WQL1_9PEZI